MLLNGLEQLEYRGYDSAGIAVGGDGIEVHKREGQLEMLQAAVEELPSRPSGPVGVGHTRWSTHGPPSDENAHPHTDSDGRVAVVHNGIVENYQILRDELIADGTEFQSQTDTEVIPKLIAAALDKGANPAAALRQTVDRLEGSYALAAAFADDDRLLAVRNDSPLVLGVGNEGNYLASDVPAFVEHTRDVVYIEDGEIAILSADDWRIVGPDGLPVERSISTVEWDADQAGKGGYDHYMLKEIHEQPNALRQSLSGRVDELEARVTIDAVADVTVPESIQFVAAGTSYHASLYGAQLFRSAGTPAQAFLASEYATADVPVDEETLVVGVTQSGETADTLSALRRAQSRGARTLALTNVVQSTAARECDTALYIRAGPEIGVAATKTLSSQLATINLLCEQSVGDRSPGHRTLIRNLRDIPDQLQRVLDWTQAQTVIGEYVDSDAYFFIGRGLNYPVALEGALKFKEITYEHAEGFAAGELKHGTLALVTEETPVFAVVTGGGERARKTTSNVKEVEARDAPVVAVTDGRNEVERYADHVLRVPEMHPRLAPILANVQLQLVAYHHANALGRAIDKPRNLAKSVTVE